MADIVKRYSLGGITVIWQPALCHHSGICARGLPMVFAIRDAGRGFNCSTQIPRL